MKYLLQLAQTVAQLRRCVDQTSKLTRMLAWKEAHDMQAILAELQGQVAILSNDLWVEALRQEQQQLTLEHRKAAG